MTVGEEEKKGKVQVCSPEEEHTGKHSGSFVFRAFSLS